MFAFTQHSVTALVAHVVPSAAELLLPMSSAPIFSFQHKNSLVLHTESHFFKNKYHLNWN